MTDLQTLHRFDAATASLPRKSSKLRDLALAACDASDAVSQGYAYNAGEREERAWSTRHAFYDILLEDFGITKAEAERIGGLL